METKDEKQWADADAAHVARCKEEAVRAIYRNTDASHGNVCYIVNLIAAGRVPHVRMDYGGAA